MRPRASDLIGAGALVLVLFGLVALIFFLTVANADPEASHSAVLIRQTVA
jgi:hypothetical protein